MCCLGLGFSGLTMLPYSMLTDIIEYDAMASGMRREGAFTGIWVATEKTGFALGGLAAGLVFGLFGFIESKTGDMVQPQSAILAISYTISLFVAAAIVISLLILRAYTIDEKSLEREIKSHSLAENKI
jgi:Na+/melibiose symporter-like transporter